MSQRVPYWELLRRPEWQRKRLEIMQRDGFKCVECGEKERTLNVHHCYYTKGAMPWDYPGEALRTLCEPCHEDYSGSLAALQKVVGKMGREQIEALRGAASAVLLLSKIIPHIVLEGADGPVDGLNPFDCGVADYFGVGVENLYIYATAEDRITMDDITTLWREQNAPLDTSLVAGG